MRGLRLEISLPNSVTLPAGARWTFYATFASPLKAAVAFGVNDIKQLREEVHSHGYHRVQVPRMLRRA